MSYPALVKLLVLVLSPVPAEESLNHFGYCFFFLYPASLTLLSFVGLIKWLSLFCKDILRFVSYLLRCVGFFGNYDGATSRGRTDSWHGWIQIFSKTLYGVCMCVRMCFLGIWWSCVQSITSCSSTFKFRILQDDKTIMNDLSKSVPDYYALSEVKLFLRDKRKNKHISVNICCSISWAYLLNVVRFSLTYSV